MCYYAKMLRCQAGQCICGDFTFKLAPLYHVPLHWPIPELVKWLGKLFLKPRRPRSTGRNGTNSWSWLLFGISRSSGNSMGRNSMDSIQSVERWQMSTTGADDDEEWGGHGLCYRCVIDVLPTGVQMTSFGDIGPFSTKTIPQPFSVPRWLQHLFSIFFR